MLTTETLSRAELRDAWPPLSAHERLEGFSLLPRPEAEALFVATLVDVRGLAIYLTVASLVLQGTLL